MIPRPGDENRPDDTLTIVYFGLPPLPPVPRCECCGKVKP